MPSYHDKLLLYRVLPPSYAIINTNGHCHIKYMPN